MAASRRSPPAADRPPLAPTSALGALPAGPAGDPLRRALWLDELDRRLRPHFPSSLGPHARVANVDGTALVFLVDSPIWHARMKLAADGLLDVARSIGLDVTRAVIRTARAQVTMAPRATVPVKPMSATARDALHSALESLRAVDDGTQRPKAPSPRKR